MSILGQFFELHSPFWAHFDYFRSIFDRSLTIFGQFLHILILIISISYHFVSLFFLILISFTLQFDYFLEHLNRGCVSHRFKKCACLKKGFYVTGKVHWNFSLWTRDGVSGLWRRRLESVWSWPEFSVKLFDFRITNFLRFQRRSWWAFYGFVMVVFCRKGPFLCLKPLIIFLEWRRHIWRVCNSPGIVFTWFGYLLMHYYNKIQQIRLDVL